MNARHKTVDKTFLSLDNAEERGFIHRDYIAHCFRWTHAAKKIQANWREATILDVGCGKEMPFPKLIYTSKMRPLHYVGVDVEETPLPEMLEKATFKCEKLIGDIAQVEMYTDLGFEKQPNFITCFEMMEHVELEHAQRCLTAIHNCMSHDGLFMVSTPVYNLKDVAGNHVNELTYDAFGAMLEDAGFAIAANYGTFASQSDLKQEWEREKGGPDRTEQVSGFAIIPSGTDEPYHAVEDVFEALRKYYDSNVLSTIFAPLYPRGSRNVLWDCTKAAKDYERQFPALEDVPRPWGSSEVAQ